MEFSTMRLLLLRWLVRMWCMPILYLTQALHMAYAARLIAILPLSDDYVNGQHIRRGYYEYLGPYTYVTIKDGKGNDEQTNTIRLFREIVQ